MTIFFFFTQSCLFFRHIGNHTLSSRASSNFSFIVFYVHRNRMVYSWDGGVEWDIE